MPTVINYAVKLNGVVLYRQATVEMDDEAGVVRVSAFNGETRRFDEVRVFMGLTFQSRRENLDSVYLSDEGTLEILRGKGCGCG